MMVSTEEQRVEIISEDNFNLGIPLVHMRVLRISGEKGRCLKKQAHAIDAQNYVLGPKNWGYF